MNTTPLMEDDLVRSVTTRLGVSVLALGLLVGAAGTAAADEDPIAVEFDFTQA